MHQTLDEAQQVNEILIAIKNSCFFFRNTKVSVSDFKLSYKSFDAVVENSREVVTIV